MTRKRTLRAHIKRLRKSLKHIKNVGERGASGFDCANIARHSLKETACD